MITAGGSEAEHNEPGKNGAEGHVASLGGCIGTSAERGANLGVTFQHTGTLFTRYAARKKRSVSATPRGSRTG
jgi:hypothetical protein